MASDETETQEVREAREAQEAAEEDLRIFETLCISSPLKVVNRSTTHLTVPSHL